MYKLLWVSSFLMFVSADTFTYETIDKANEAYANGEFHKSTKLFKSLEEDDPAVAYNIANAQYKAGMYTDALESYEKAQGTDEAIRQYNIGNCYFKKGNLKEAIRRYSVSLRLREDEDTRFNLELAKRKKEEQQREKEQKKKEKKKEKKKKSEEEKKKEREKKKQEEEKKKQEEQHQESKKDGQEKENDAQRKANEKEANAAQKREKSKKDMTPEEKMRKKELSHLLKQLSKQKMPTMMYQTTTKEGEKNDKNPW